jgi:very-short-patch-repair endonuclease
MPNAHDLFFAALGPGWVREHRFAAEHVGREAGLRARLALHGLRDWRFDYAHPARRIAVEIEGGGWSGGRHTRGAGFEEDLKKYAAAARLGWQVLRFSPAMMQSGEALATVHEVLHGD